MNNHSVLRLGTRASPMARAMAGSVRDLIVAEAPHMDVSIISFVAEGDKIVGSLKDYGGKGTFIKDLEQRLLAGEIDCAVHSLKDIPGDVPPHEDLALIAFLTRDDPRDALILRAGVTEDDLRAGGRVIGTSAPRRCAALKRLYPESRTELCRGNVNSRLAKLEAGKFDALVLSYAGLVRLNFANRVSRVYGVDEILPAIGQGIMSIQVRKADRDRCPHLMQLNSLQTQAAVLAERAMLFRLQGNCHSAIAGYCELVAGDLFRMRGIVSNPETGHFIEAVYEGTSVEGLEKLGERVADDLLRQGALGFL